MPHSMATTRSPLLPGNGRRNPKLRPRQWSTKRGFAVGILLLVLYFLILRWTRALVPKLVAHKFGVAFDLTSPYGTAAISYPNGTIIDVAKLDAPPSYRKMMFRLSLRSSERKIPRELPDYINDMPREAYRSFRKGLGLPASSDVGELAKLITSLRSTVEAHLDGFKISGAAVTAPHLAALYQEDLLDAFEYAGLIHISSSFPYNFDHIFSESTAVYAGNGFGLCANYTVEASCEEQKRHLSNETFQDNLFISYTREVLISTWSREYRGSVSPYSTSFNSDLGWNELRKIRDDENYWKAVKKTILTPILRDENNMHANFTKVFLHGDCSTDLQFQEVVEVILTEISQKKPEIFVLEPVYSAARGAAEMAKRAQWKDAQDQGR